MAESIKIGYSFEEKRTFSVKELQKMATDCGDMNFIHHNIAEAKETRFGDIIASGSAISAIFSAMIPTNISKINPMLGLEMSFKFPAPVRANIEITMGWRVSEVDDKPNTINIVTLLGTVTDNKGCMLVEGVAKIVLLPHL